MSLENMSKNTTCDLFLKYTIRILSEIRHITIFENKNSITSSEKTDFVYTSHVRDEIYVFDNRDESKESQGEEEVLAMHAARVMISG